MRHLITSLCLCLLLMTAGIRQAQAQEHSTQEVSTASKFGLQRQFGIEIGTTPQIFYSKPLSERALLVSSLGVNFAWGRNDYSHFFSTSNLESSDQKFFTGLIPVLGVGLRYYPLQISHTRWVKNRGIYAEIGSYAVLNPLRLFPSGNYHDYVRNHVSLLPHAMLGFRAQILGVLTVDYALGMMNEHLIGSSTPNRQDWGLATRISLGITL